MDYKVNDKELQASIFISFVNQVWKGDYDEEKRRKRCPKH